MRSITPEATAKSTIACAIIFNEIYKNKFSICKNDRIELYSEYLSDALKNKMSSHISYTKKENKDWYSIAKLLFNNSRDFTKEEAIAHEEIIKSISKCRRSVFKIN